MAALKTLRERIKALEAEGYPVLRSELTHAGHYRIWFQSNGHEYFVIVPSTPSDRLSMKKMLMDARKLTSGVLVQRTKK